MSNKKNDNFYEHYQGIVSELESVLRATRNQSTYISLDEIIETLRVVFKEECNLIKEKL